MNYFRWHKTFLGVRQQHCYGLYAAIDLVLEQNPQIERFVEVGTGGGALSVVLALHAIQRFSYLLTFDIHTRGDRSKLDRVFDALQVESHLLDCFSEEAGKCIDWHIAGLPCFFFCDGGDKLKEFQTFAPILPPKSIIAVHDYDTPSLDKDQADKVAGDLSLVPYLPEVWCGGIDDIRTCFFLKERLPSI